MPRRRTDLVSEYIDTTAPRWMRWILWVSLPVIKLARVLIALQALGGAIGIIVGLVTLDWKLVVVGFGQLLFAGAILGMHFGSEEVREIAGPAGGFVVRIGHRRAWKDAHGLGRIKGFVIGDGTWAVVVRRREDDPFGRPILVRTADTQRNALSVAEQLKHIIHHGSDPALVFPLAAPASEATSIVQK